MDVPLSEESKTTIASLKSRGVKLQITRVHETSFSCRASYSDGRDPNVTYAPTADQAVSQTAGVVRGIWKDVFDAAEDS